MTRPEMDLNDVSRFVDGEMDKAEHERAVAHFSASDDDADLLADVAFLLGDAEEAPDAADLPARAKDAAGETKVIPLAPPSTARTRPRRVPAQWLALAAVLAGVLLIPFALSRSGGRDGDFRDIEVLISTSPGLPAGWEDQSRPWSVTRGSSDAVIDDARAARLGALHMDLELAVAGRQVDQTARFASQIVAMLDESDIPAAGFAASPYRQIATRAGDPADALAPLLKEGRETLIGLVDEDAFSLGAWAEAAQVAARQRDIDFFRARASQKMADRAATLASLDDPTRTSINALRAAGEADGEVDWAALEAHARQLLGHLAG